MAKLLALALAAASVLGGQTVVTYRSAVDQTEQPYALYVPKSYDPARRYPLVVSLHEEESNHVVNLKRVFGVPPRYGESGLQALSTLPMLRDVDYMVVCPFGRGTMGYQGIAEQDVYDVLADVKSRYSVDEDRVYLTGASMGGGGALWLALTRPDVWAAVAPVCADVFPGTADLAPNALNLPVRLFHGDSDPSVRVESSRQWQRRLLSLESPVEYIEFPGVRHNAWDFAYRNGSIFEWFAKYRRNANPDRVRLVTRDLHYSAAYWVRIDAIAPGVLASVDAVRTAGGVRVQTQDVDAFTLATTAKTVTIDGGAVRLRPAAALSFTKTPKGWTQGPAGRRRAPGADCGGGQRPPHLCLRRRRSANAPLRGDGRGVVQQTDASESDPARQERSRGQRRRSGRRQPGAVRHAADQPPDCALRSAVPDRAQSGRRRLRAALHPAGRQTLCAGELRTSLVDRRGRGQSRRISTGAGDLPPAEHVRGLHPIQGNFGERVGGGAFRPQR